MVFRGGSVGRVFQLIFPFCIFNFEVFVNVLMKCVCDIYYLVFQFWHEEGCYKMVYIVGVVVWAEKQRE